MLRSRRRLPVLATTGLVVAASALALSGGVGPHGPAAQALSVERTSAERFAEGCRTTAVRFGMVLADEDRAGRRAAQAVADDIGRQIGCPAIVVTRPTQPALLAALALHQVDFAQVDPATLIVGERVVALAIMGTYSTDPDAPARAGAPPRLWVLDDSPIRELGDARGRSVALGPALTVGGDLAPRNALLEAGVALDGPTGPGARSGDGGQVVRTADDGEALRALRDGDAEVALTRGEPTAAATRGLREIWSGEAPLADVMVLRPGIDDEVRRLLLSAVRDVPGRLLDPLAARQGIDDPIPLLFVPRELYDGVADQLDALTAAGLAPS